MLCNEVYLFVKRSYISISRFLVFPFIGIASTVMAEASAVGEVDIKRDVVFCSVVGIFYRLDEITFIDFFEIVGWGITGVSRCLNIIFVDYFLVHRLYTIIAESMLRRS
jgi:hypothetical protein